MRNNFQGLNADNHLIIKKYNKKTAESMVWKLAVSAGDSTTKFIYLRANSAAMAECEEAGGKSPATKVWNGLKVCDDHYDKYRHQHESMMSGFD